jgi:hypothetical protein
VDRDEEASIIGITQFLHHAPLASWQQASSGVKALLTLPVSAVTVRVWREVQEQPGFEQLCIKAASDKPGNARMFLRKLEEKYG